MCASSPFPVSISKSNSIADVIRSFSARVPRVLKLLTNSVQILLTSVLCQRWRLKQLQQARQHEATCDPFQCPPAIELLVPYTLHCHQAGLCSTRCVLWKLECIAACHRLWPVEQTKASIYPRLFSHLGCAQHDRAAIWRTVRGTLCDTWHQQHK